MARTYSSVTFFCKNDCGTEITFRRDDFLPKADWQCPACDLEQLDRVMAQTPTPYDFDRPVFRVGFDSTAFPQVRES
jgi:hypothetical protein